MSKYSPISSLLPSLSAALILSGCVSSGKYRTLEDTNEKTRQSLAAAEARVSELEGKLGIASTERNKLEGDVSNMKQALQEMSARRAEAEKRIQEFRELTSKFQKMVDAGQLSVKISDGRMLVVLSTDVLFPSGSARLSKAGATAIQEVAATLATIEGRSFQIEGHTDNVPIKTAVFGSNWDLASARALTVVNTMLGAGMPPERISAASFGATKPVADNSAAEGRMANRRIEIVVVPDLSSLPGFDELSRMSKGESAAKATP